MEPRVPTVTAPIVPSGRPEPFARVTRPGGAGPPTGRGRRRRRDRASRVLRVPTRPGLLDCIERYFAAAPLPDARIQAVGALDVPIGDPAWPYPARPRAGGGPVTADDVRAAVALQEESGLPAALEWVPERSPGTAAAARAAGLTVEELPLLVAVDPVELLLPRGRPALRRRAPTTPSCRATSGSRRPPSPTPAAPRTSATCRWTPRPRRGRGRRSCASGSPPAAP